MGFPSRILDIGIQTMKRDVPSNCGVVYVAWGERYLRQAAQSARRVTKYPVALITDDPAFTDPAFARVIRKPLTDRHFYGKLEAMRETPFDVTLFLDVEAKVIGDVSLGFKAADRYGLACVLAPGGVFQLDGNEYVHYQGGVWFFRGRPVEFADRILSYASTFPTSDEPAFSLALDDLGINPYVLPVAFDLVAAGWIHPRTVRIWHGRSPIQTHLVSNWEYPFDRPDTARSPATQPPNPQTLSELLSQRSANTDKNSGHTYGPAYDAWFGPFRDRPIRLLELGASGYGGGDLLAFSEYFQHGAIWAVDHTLERLLPAVREHPRIHLVLADAYADQTPAMLGDQGFDVIIDDCDHRLECQQRAASLYSPLLRTGGLYVVEDCTRDSSRRLAGELSRVPWLADIEIRDMADAPHPADNVLVRAVKKGGPWEGGNTTPVVAPIPSR